MDYRNDDDGIECKIIESYGIFSRGVKSWNKEVNLVSWNGRPAKLDIRSWKRDHSRCGKGIVLTREEAEDLQKLLNRILGSGREGTKKQTSAARNRQSPDVPKTLEAFYRELKVAFGSGPAQCRTARNNLLKKYHPDMNVYSVNYATAKTIKIKEAYEKIIAWWNANTAQ